MFFFFVIGVNFDKGSIETSSVLKALRLSIRYGLDLLLLLLLMLLLLVIVLLLVLFLLRKLLNDLNVLDVF